MKTWEGFRSILDADREAVNICEEAKIYLEETDERILHKKQELSAKYDEILNLRLKRYEQNIIKSFDIEIGNFERASRAVINMMMADLMAAEKEYTDLMYKSVIGESHG